MTNGELRPSMSQVKKFAALQDGGTDAARLKVSGVRQKWRRIRHLIRKEFIQITRNKQNFRMLLVAPLFQLLLLGYAVRLDVDHVATVVVDHDRTSTSRQLIDTFSRSGYFVIKGYPRTYNEANSILSRGDAKVALLIPSDFSRRILGDQNATIGVYIDGVDTITASTVSGYVDGIVARYSMDSIQDRLKRARGLRYVNDMPDVILPSLEVETRAWFNTNLESKDYFVPGVLALLIMFIGVSVTSMVIVREKETGTIEQLMVTPITRSELILGKTIPSFLIAMINLVTMTLITFLWFQPIFRGSMVLFMTASVLFAVSALGIGMVISTFCRTQQQAMLTSFFVMQPSVILSGFVFPIENMPKVIQLVTYINPLRYIVVIIREVFLKGIGWDILWPQLLPLAAMGLFYLGLASFLFKKKID
jgi:ABC-2 type transport system permease protein